jgi:hypothetical protein
VISTVKSQQAVQQAPPPVWLRVSWRVAPAWVTDALCPLQVPGTWAMGIWLRVTVILLLEAASFIEAGVQLVSPFL